MKRILVCCVSFFISVLSMTAQSDNINKLLNVVVDVTGSFLDNPNHHSNTIKVFERSKELKNNVDNLYNYAQYSNNTYAKLDLPYLENMKYILKCLDFVTANIAGYTRGGIDAIEWETVFHPMMTELGWTWGIIHSTPEVVFYEYKKDKFKMVLAKNIRSKKEGGDYNANSFSCYTWIPQIKENHIFLQRIVFGGNYVFVEFGDDEFRYKKISKVTSKRGKDF